MSLFLIFRLDFVLTLMLPQEDGPLFSIPTSLHFELVKFLRRPEVVWKAWKLEGGKLGISQWTMEGWASPNLVPIYQVFRPLRSKYIGNWKMRDGNLRGHPQLPFCSSRPYFLGVAMATGGGGTRVTRVRFNSYHKWLECLIGQGWVTITWMFHKSLMIGMLCVLNKWLECLRDFESLLFPNLNTQKFRVASDEHLDESFGMAMSPCYFSRCPLRKMMSSVWWSPIWCLSTIGYIITTLFTILLLYYTIYTTMFQYCYILSTLPIVHIVSTVSQWWGCP